jgi:hypothetical protein
MLFKQTGDGDQFSSDPSKRNARERRIEKIHLSSTPGIETSGIEKPTAPICAVGHGHFRFLLRI